jgi:hypothetical protein
MEKRNKRSDNEIGGNASILAGGDGSRKSRNGETIAAYRWGVYGIGNTRWNIGKISTNRSSNHGFRREHGLGS